MAKKHNPLSKTDIEESNPIGTSSVFHLYHIGGINTSTQASCTNSDSSRMLWGDCTSYCCCHAVFPRRIQTSLSIASSVRFKVTFEQQGVLNKNKAFSPPSIRNSSYACRAVQNKCDGLLGGSAEGSRQVKWADLDPRWRLIGWLDNWVLSERPHLAWQVCFFDIMLQSCCQS